jgi:predicted Zn-dependent protease
MSDEGWMGVVFDSGLPRGQSDCTLSVRGRRLVARLPSGDALDIDLGRMEHQRGGADGRTHVFTSTTTSGVTITTTDDRVFAAVTRARPAGRASEGLTLGQKLVLAAAAISVTAAVLALLLMGPLARVAVAAIPFSVDHDLGARALAGALLPLRAGDDSAPPIVSAAVATTMERLQSALARPELSFQVTVVDSKVVNAFALPDGHILVTTALLRVMGSADELAAVLAHEISHVTGRHVIELMVRRAGLGVILMGLTGAGESAGRNLLAASASLASLGFNREMEGQADEHGLELLSRALIDPHAAVTVMERIAEQEGEAGTAHEYLHTHPLTRTRIEAMERWLERHPPQGAFAVEADWKAVDRALSRGH